MSLYTDVVIRATDLTSIRIVYHVACYVTVGHVRTTRSRVHYDIDVGRACNTVRQPRHNPRLSFLLASRVTALYSYV